MRLAITGGGGRVGAAVTKMAIDRGHELVLIDQHPPQPEVSGGIAFRQGDVTDFPFVVAAIGGCDAVVHLAAIAGPKNDQAHVVHHNNVVGSYNVLLAAGELGISRVVQASSVNAIGATWSRQPYFDYFPIDEHHRTYNEDPYSLSKWIAEQQADSVVRFFTGLSVASLRFHAVVDDRRAALALTAREGDAWAAKGLWGYTTDAMITDASLLACAAPLEGHEVFFIIASDSASDVPSEQLRAAHYRLVRGGETTIVGRQGFFDCSKAERLLGWSGTTGPRPNERKTEAS